MPCEYVYVKVVGEEEQMTGLTMVRLVILRIGIVVIGCVMVMVPGAVMVTFTKVMGGGFFLRTMVMMWNDTMCQRQRVGDQR